MREKYLYVILMQNIRPLTKEVVENHVEHLRRLDEKKILVICGPCIDYQGGIVIIKADSLEKAHAVAKADPFIAGGYKTYEIRTMEWAHSDNNYGLD